MGFALGLILGYVFMGTAHAFMNVGSRRLLEDGNSVGTVSAQQRSHQENFNLRPKKSENTPTRVQGSQKQVPNWPESGDKIHVLFTSNGSPYLNFQSRIMYATYKLVQTEKGGDKLIAMTRILHRTKPDVLMDEIPTFRADPKTPKCDEWCEYPVADRPNAVRQFFDAAMKNTNMIKAPWLYMIETDYVWIQPLQAPQAEEMSAKALLFPFHYISPTHPNAAKIMRKFYPESSGPLTDIPNTGPAPAMMRATEWLQVMPHWEAIADQVEKDPEAVEALGWVREMYAFSLACAISGTAVDLTAPPRNKLINQPPADHVMGDASASHYTWGSIIKDALGKEVWQFDKRTYTAKELETHTPLIPELPAFQDGWKLQDGVSVSEELYGTLQDMVRQMNKGIQMLSDLPA